MRERIVTFFCLSLLLSACGAPEAQRQSQAPSAAQQALSPTVVPTQPPTHQASQVAQTSQAISSSPVLPTASAQLITPVIAATVQGPISQKTSIPTTRPTSIPTSIATAVLQPSSAAPTPQTPAPAATSGSAVASPIPVPPSALPESSMLPPDDLLQPIRADLSRRTAVAIKDIVVLQSEAISWPDGSLGCAAPGVSYTMEPQEGFRVLLSAAGQSYDYRVTWQKQFVLCERSS